MSHLTWIHRCPVLVEAGAIFAVLLTLGLCASASAEDHNGEDVVIVQDTVWSGVHTNIRRLIINDRATLSAAPEETLRIQADVIEVFGTLTASEAGLSGGLPGDRGRGASGGQGSGGGGRGSDGAVCGRPGIDYNAGGGGGGAASHVGLGGRGGAGADANDGGCQGAGGGAQGAAINDLTPRMGSGGGGGGGAGGRRHALGTEGLRGGGLLILDTKTLRVEGSISANGGAGGTGGTSPDFFHGGGGGGGAAGGSIQITTTYLLGAGIISSRGGSGGNGGQGDQVSGESFTGAGGGGGSGGLVIMQYANRTAFTGRCDVAGGGSGAGQNTNGGPGASGAAGRCVEQEINGTPTADPGGPYIGVEGQPLTLDGSRSIDPDGDAMTFEWDCDGNNTFELRGPSVQCTFSADGPYTVRLRVSDGQGAQDTASAEVVITEGPPDALLTAPDRVNENDAIRLDASGSNGFGDQITQYEWDFNYDGNFQADIPATQTPITSTTFCDNGVYTVAVRVTDDGGSTALALRRVIVTNVAPVVTSRPVTAAAEGVPYSHQIQIQDPGCDTHTYVFITRPEGMSVDADGLVTFRPTFRQALEGETTIRLLISDDDFGRITHEWVLRVVFTDADRDGLPDTWELFFGLNPATPTDARQDPDGDGRDNLAEFNSNTNPTEFDGPTRPRLSSPRDGGEVTSLTPLLRAFRSQSPIGDELTYELEVYDSVEGEEMLRPELLVVEAEGLQPEFGSPSLEWTVPQSAELQDHTRYCWRVRALDTLVPGRWSDLWCFFVNINNEAPTAPTILRPEDDTQLDNGRPTLTVGNCADPDLDPLAYTFILYRGDGIATPVASASNMAEGLDGSTSWALDVELDENENYCWRVQCRDNEGLTSPYSDVACFVINRENELPGAPLIISPVAEEGAERAHITETPVSIVIRNSVDPEGDAILYRFQLDTSILFDTAGLLDEELAGSNSGETIWVPEVDWRDNTVYFVRVQASDGQGASAFSVTEFFLNFENDPPTAPALRTPINNTLIFTRQPTLTVVNAIDPDGDALKYTFEVFSDSALTLPVDRRGGVVETPETTQYRVVSTQLVDGTYYWRASSNDGNADSPQSEVGVFIVRADGGPGGNPDPDAEPEGAGPDANPGGSPVDEGDCACASPPASPASPAAGLVLVLGALGLILLRRRR